MPPPSRMPTLLTRIRCDMEDIKEQSPETTDPKRLRQIMETVIQEKGGKDCNCVDFFIDREVCRLCLEEGVDVLAAEEGELTTDLIDWFRIWYSNHIQDQNITLTMPFLLKPLKDWVSDHGEGYESLQDKFIYAVHYVFRRVKEAPKEIIQE